MKPPIRVLYAEDNPQDADLARAHFEQEAPDFALEVVASGEACLARLRAESFDLLLLDHHLPDMDGLELLRQLTVEGPRVPVVMVTGVGHDELVMQALRAGACYYVPKSGDHLATLPAILRPIV